MNSKIVNTVVWIRRFLPWKTLLTLGVIAYIVFFSNTSVVKMHRYDKTIDSLRTELKANRDTMLYYQNLNRRLTCDPEVMEQVVREQYGMKKENEDVYVFEKKQ